MIGGVIRNGMLALVVVFTASCAEIVRNHGYAPTDFDLEDIVVGVDTRGDVETAVGRPGTASVLEDGDWYYVGSRVRHYGWKAPQEVERQVVAVSFNADDTVANIERFGLENGRVVTLSRRVTASTVRDATFIRQLIRNFGQIDLGEALGDDG